MTRMPEASDTMTPIRPNLIANLLSIRESLGSSDDLIVREIRTESGIHIAVLFMDGLADDMLVHESVIDPLMQVQRSGDGLPVHKDGILSAIQNGVLTAGDVSVLRTMEPFYSALLSGDAMLLADGCPACLRIGAAGAEDRSVSEPTSQSVVRGPMEAFTENFRTNTALIRRKIKDPNLWLETRQIGTVTKTTVGIMYLNHIVDINLVGEVRRRLESIEIDSILESGYIEELIQDKGYTPFATLYNSERPDTIAAGLLEGRVAILVDGTPFTLLAPALFVHFFQAAEDYYQRADISSVLRLIRYLAFYITMFAPALYIAITTFHQEMLPTSLLINLAAQREGVPFPAFVEAIIMEATYEIIREAGVRMPRTVGQAVSIVGTLVIGQAAVEAGIVSAVMVIIVSITAISSYVIPAVSMSITVRMIRFAFMALSASFGLYGMLIGVIGLAIHMSAIRSFGIPYMSPFGPYIAENQKDTLIRVPWKRMKLRPKPLNRNNPVRQKSRS